MARLVRYQANRRGMADLATSRKVDEMLEGRAQRVADAATAVYAAHGHEVNVEVEQRSSDTPERARVAVIARHPAAIRFETAHRALGGSLDAARG